MFPDIRIEHNRAIFRREAVPFYGSILFGDGHGVSLSIGLDVFPANTTGEIVFRSHFMCFVMCFLVLLHSLFAPFGLLLCKRIIAKITGHNKQDVQGLA